MDYKKLYTPTEATALYNVAKIKFDPTSYTLKGNLITNCDAIETMEQHISSFYYTSDIYLKDAIYENEPRKNVDILTGMSGEDRSAGLARSAWSAMCVQQDNLYLCLDLLQHYFPLNNIKKTNIVQTLVSMCVALNSTKSCAKDMLYLAMPKMVDKPYSKIHNFEVLKEQLKSKSTPLSLLMPSTSLDATYAPAKESVTSFMLSETRDIDTLYSHVINSLEVLWAWRSLPDVYKDCFVEICNTAQEFGKFDTELYKAFFTLTKSEFAIRPDIDAIISIPNPEERYEAYQKMLKTDFKDIYNICADYYHTEFPKNHYINSIFIAYTSFIMQLSTANIRINTIRILYDYCITNGYLKPSDSDVDEDKSGILSKFGMSLGTSTSKPEKSLVDFSDHKYGSVEDDPDFEDDEDEGVHDSTAMFEALDKVKASFNSGKYRFTVRDVCDTDSVNQSKYNAVASKIETVNKLLIRRIKDIKTYNVGGKNSGMPSGRLDKKAIYRYKYDPNIFYNNTYKTLESDLAFGIILDESGSMSGKGIENGRITMVVLHETLKALGINHCIIGHTSDGKHHSDIYRYQSFKEDKTYKVCKNYALIKTSAKSGNCDSGALYYMEKALDRVKNKDKICLIFSDGSPTECTGTELRNQVKHMERKGIKVIGIGINFASIAKYYTDYANGRNLTDMLNIVAKILEEYVLKKKDK